MSETQMVLTAVGPDRPGIVQAISSAIYESGANIEDSRMAVLAGDFALIVLFSGSPDSVEKVRAEVRLEDAAKADVLEKALGPACEDMNLSLDLKKA